MPPRKPEEIFVERLGDLLKNREAKLVAKGAGISETTISRWRNWKPPERLPNPHLDTLVRLAHALRVPIVHLISDGVYEPTYDPAAVDQMARAMEELIRAAYVAGRALNNALKKP